MTSPHPLLPPVSLPNMPIRGCPACPCGAPPRCLCSCQFPREPLFVLCEKCFSKHQKILANHNYLETAAFEFIRSIEDLAELRKRNVYRNEMKESLRKIESCRSEMETAVSSLLQWVQDYKARVFAKLEECVEKVNEGIALIDKMQYTSADNFQFPYRNVTFTYEISADQLMKDVESLCRFDIDDVGNDRQRKSEDPPSGLDCVKVEPDGKGKDGPIEPQTASKRKSSGVVRLPKKKCKGTEDGGTLPKLEEGESMASKREDCLVVNFTP